MLTNYLMEGVQKKLRRTSCGLQQQLRVFGGFLCNLVLLEVMMNPQNQESSNPGNFLSMVKLIARLNVDVANVIMEKAPKNAIYTSPTIQKEVLHILANKVRKKIREKIGEAKFCILIDEARDVSHKEQMAIVLRFVDLDGFLRERFFSSSARYRHCY